jgi:TetR/AcrR family transcriptional regulator
VSPEERKAIKTRISGEQRRLQMVTVAAQLFAKFGYEGVTVKDIADACEINQALLYRHFTSKELLFTAVLDHKIDQLDINSFLESISKEVPLEELLQILARHILKLGLNDPEINRLLLFGTLQGTPEAKDLFRSWRQPFVTYLQAEIIRRIEIGELRKVDPALTARSFIGMVMDCSVSCFLWPEFGYEQFDPERSIANNVGVYVKGMKP